MVYEQNFKVVGVGRKIFFQGWPGPSPSGAFWWPMAGAVSTPKPRRSSYFSGLSCSFFLLFRDLHVQIFVGDAPDIKADVMSGLLVFETHPRSFTSRACCRLQSLLSPPELAAASRSCWYLQSLLPLEVSPHDPHRYGLLARHRSNPRVVPARIRPTTIAKIVNRTLT